MKNATKIGHEDESPWSISFLHRHNIVSLSNCVSSTTGKQNKKWWNLELLVLVHERNHLTMHKQTQMTRWWWNTYKWCEVETYATYGEHTVALSWDPFRHKTHHIAHMTHWVEFAGACVCVCWFRVCWRWKWWVFFEATDTQRYLLVRNNIFVVIKCDRRGTFAACGCTKILVFDHVNACAIHRSETKEGEMNDVKRKTMMTATTNESKNRISNFC